MYEGLVCRKHSQESALRKRPDPASFYRLRVVGMSVNDSQGFYASEFFMQFFKKMVFF